MTISVDDGIRAETSLSNLAKLKAVFKKDGSTTAGIGVFLTYIFLMISIFSIGSNAITTINYCYISFQAILAK